MLYCSKSLVLLIVMFLSVVYGKDQTIGLPTAILSNTSTTYQLNQSSRYFIDTTQTFKARKIAELSDDFWTRRPSLPYSGGYSKYPLWVRLTLFDSSDSHDGWVLSLEHPLLDTVEVYMVDSAGIHLYATTGRMTAKLWPAIPDAQPMWIVPKINDRPISLLLRITTTDFYSVSLKAVDLWNYLQAKKLSTTLYGLYYGAIIVMVIFNVMLFFFARFRSCLWYSLYVVMFGLFKAAACGFFSHATFPSMLISMATPFFVGASIFFGALFAIDFLSMRTLSGPKHLFFHISIFFAALGIAICALAPFADGRYAAIAASIVSPLFVLIYPVAGIALLKPIGRPAGFLAVASGIMAIGIILNTLRNFGILPDTLLTSQGNLLGSAFEFLIISIALSDRVAILRKERSEAQHVAKQAELLSTESRLRTLQAQINPHFLFNTLNMLTELIHTFPEKAEAMVVSLSRLFRSTLDASVRQTIRLSEELETVKTYLSIEKERFGNRLQYDIKVTGDPQRASVCGLLIQPLVENSVKYGIVPHPDGGSITVVCDIGDRYVFVRVGDTGPGFGAISNGGMGHGIGSVRERLLLTYGPSATMRCFNENGAIVEIRFPRREYSDV